MRRLLEGLDIAGVKKEAVKTTTVGSIGMYKIKMYICDTLPFY